MTVGEVTEREPETVMDPGPEMGGREVERDWVGSEVGRGEIVGIGREAIEL